MRLSELLPDLDLVQVTGDVATDVRRVVRDHREVAADAVFVAIRGGRVDGHDLVPGLQAGAVVAERAVPGFAGPVVIVRDSRAALGPIAAALHGHPTAALPVLGVTGTKGKTTVTALIEGALGALGRVGGRIGTLGSFVGGRTIPSALTTPEAHDLQALFATMRDAGAEAVAVEVSSIGLVQHRLAGTRVHTAAFTNLGHDHLDFHGTMEAYLAAKALLFREPLLRPAGGMPRALLAFDDPATQALGAPADAWNFGFGSGADLRIEGLVTSPRGLRATLGTPMGPIAVDSPLVGRHNAQNLACAAGMLLTLGLTPDDVAAGLAAVPGVAGRLEVVPSADRLVVVDYAHTPESLEAVLNALRDLPGRGDVWVLFGCGGDRDAGKRPVMGEVATRLADHVVVTSDNPRSEPPAAIVAAIVAGCPRAPAIVEVDRKAAIEAVLAASRPGDVVLLAGKGHETYQEIAGVRIPFDDRVVARAAMEGR